VEANNRPFFGHEDVRILIEQPECFHIELGRKEVFGGSTPLEMQEEKN
jgi:hypothetical protein